jgi:hypothetical protein
LELLQQLLSAGARSGNWVCPEQGGNVAAFRKISVLLGAANAWLNIAALLRGS